MSVPSIEFQYFQGCPNADSTLINLREALSELNFSENCLKLTDVPSPELAKELKFQGSPSILIDGKDIYTGEPPCNFSYACRLYRFDVKQTGVIPKEFILQKLIGNPS